MLQFPSHFCRLAPEENLPTFASVLKAHLVGLPGCWFNYHSWFLYMTTTKKFLLWFILILLLAWFAVRIAQLKQASNTEKMKFEIGSVENRPTAKLTIEFKDK